LGLRKNFPTLSIAFLAQALQIGSAIALLPFVGLYLDPAEVGAWYIFLLFQNFTILLESGSTQAFVRFYVSARESAPFFQPLTAAH
jgi:hypothetical protein